jgi:hypothetical protein
MSVLHGSNHRFGTTVDGVRPSQQSGYTIRKRGRYLDWMVLDRQGELVRRTVYRRGAMEVVRRLAE